MLLLLGDCHHAYFKIIDRKNLLLLKVMSYGLSTLNFINQLFNMNNEVDPELVNGKIGLTKSVSVG